jgi:poly(A) polymerase
MMQIQPDWLTAPWLKAVFAALGPDHVRVVGGAVRDALRGQAVGDVDMATTLTPDGVTARAVAAGLKVVPTGIDHGTVTVVSAGRGVEVTTLRADVATDGRHATVAFTTDWSIDAHRRDFHLNAVYMDAAGQVFDPTGLGVAHARDGRVVFIGDAHARIAEDYLRILRFFRFSARFAAVIDPAGLAAVHAMKDGLLTLSAERVWHELNGLLAVPDAAPTVAVMRRAGVWGIIAPEAARDLPADIPADPVLRLAVMIATENGAELCAKRLKLSRRDATRLVAACGPLRTGDEAALKAHIYRLGAQTVIDRSWVHQPDGATHIRALAQTWPVPKFPLTGRDAAAAGIPAGPEMGAWLQAREEAWIAAGFPEREA